MSRRLISLSADLRRLQDEGYDIVIMGGYLLMRDVPYVTTEKKVAYGTLVSNLELAGQQTVRPSDHVARFAGATPCNWLGEPLHKVINSSNHEVLAEGVEVDHVFSSKPPEGYADYYQKMTTYANILGGPAQAIEPTATAKTFPVIEGDEADSVFCYEDTASSRADIAAVNAKLQVAKVAIVGCGGTGSYVLDLLAKTPVGEIHLFDGDRFLQHNAFRTPGAASIEQLRTHSTKADYLAATYSKMRRNIVPHPAYLCEANAEELDEMSFVFLCMDKGEARRAVVDRLRTRSISFIDVGMGVYKANGSLAGLLRLTTATQDTYALIEDKHRIHFGKTIEDEYSTNIQIAELNALCAALAVIKWKKLVGFYADLEREHFSVYTIDGNHLLNEDQA